MKLEQWQELTNKEITFETDFSHYLYSGPMSFKAKVVQVLTAPKRTGNGVPTILSIEVYNIRYAHNGVTVPGEVRTIRDTTNSRPSMAGPRFLRNAARNGPREGRVIIYPEDIKVTHISGVALKFLFGHHLARWPFKALVLAYYTELVTASAKMGLQARKMFSNSLHTEDKETLFRLIQASRCLPKEPPDFSYHENVENLRELFKLP